jgi:hypothetical protein
MGPMHEAPQLLASRDRGGRPAADLIPPPDFAGPTLFPASQRDPSSPETLAPSPLAPALPNPAALFLDARLGEVFAGRQGIRFRVVSVEPALPYNEPGPATSAAHPTNDGLMEAARGGHEGALVTLVQRHRERLDRRVELRVARRLLAVSIPPT